MNGTGDAGPAAAVYCRIPHRRAADQSAVTVQEQACRRAAAGLGVQIAAGHVYVDNHRSAWLRDRPRPGWTALLAAARAGQFAHLLIDRPARLLHEPADLEEVLQIALRHGLVLHGEVRGHDLTDPTSHRALRAEIRRDCRARDAVGRAARTAHETAAAAGRAHGGGRRAYGYTPGSRDLIESEAATVRDVYAWFLAGASMRSIAVRLNQHGVPTATGSAWTVERIARLLDAPRYASLRIFRGEVGEAGDWTPCVSVPDWRSVRQRRALQAAEHRSGQAPARHYLLTGLLVCTACERHMVGSYPTYARTGNSVLTPRRCPQRIAAAKLEQYVASYAFQILSTVDDMVVLPGRRLVVPGEPAVQHQPAQAPLHHPAPLHHVGASRFGVSGAISASIPTVAACSTNWILKPASTQVLTTLG